MRAWLRTALCGGALLASLAAPVRADIRYVIETTMDMGGSNAPSMTMTTMVKGKRERVDTKMDMGPMKMQRTSLTLCDLRQRMEISDAAKIFTVSPLDPISRLTAGATPQQKQGRKTSGTGQMVTTVTVKDLGPEKIGQFNTQHYAIKMTLESSGCAGSDTSSFDSEIWVSAAVPVFSCPETQQASYTAESDGCKISYTMKGDVAKFAQIESGLVVQRKFSQPGGGSMVQRVTSYEGNVTLNAADFEPPSGYTKVSSSDFEQAATRAMMQQMQQQMQQMQNGGSDD